MGPVSRSVVLVAALAATAACATRAPSIAQLKVESARYHGRTVSVEGVVTSAWGVPLLPLKFYKIDDWSGEIAVLANSGVVPSRGARVRVTGTWSRQITPAKVSAIDTAYGWASVARSWISSREAVRKNSVAAIVPASTAPGRCETFAGPGVGCRMLSTINRRQFLSCITTSQQRRCARMRRVSTYP